MQFHEMCEISGTFIAARSSSLSIVYVYMYNHCLHLREMIMCIFFYQDGEVHTEHL